MLLRLLTYNIRYGGVGREESLAAVIRSCNPDVVVMQEATRPDVVERLARAVDMRTFASRPRYSLAFMSRVPVPEYDWKRPRWSKHSFLQLVPEGTNVRLFGIHLSAVHSNWTEQRRAYELRALLSTIERQNGFFHVMTGDFNTLAPGEELDLSKLPPRLRVITWLTGRRIRWQTIQIVADAGYVDGYRSLHPKDKGLTFPTWDPHVRLDYVFVPSRYGSCLKSCEVLREPAEELRLASDHHPLLAELEVADVRSASL